MKTHPQVRDLLAKIKHPYRLENDRLGLAVRDALGARTVREAVLAVVDAALAPLDPRLARMIERCDVAGTKITAVAREFHVTPRQLYRYRSVAVAAIAEKLDDILSRPSRRWPRPGDVWEWPTLSA